MVDAVAMVDGTGPEAAGWRSGQPYAAYVMVAVDSGGLGGPAASPVAAAFHSQARGPAERKAGIAGTQ